MTFDIIAVCCAFPPIDDIELFIENEKKVATPADVKSLISKVVM